MEMSAFPLAAASFDSGHGQFVNLARLQLFLPSSNNVEVTSFMLVVNNLNATICSPTSSPRHNHLPAELVS
jgi:hypothetical protein